jgi:hypothetical protein
MQRYVLSPCEVLQARYHMTSFAVHLCGLLLLGLRHFCMPFATELQDQSWQKLLRTVYKDGRTDSPAVTAPAQHHLPESLQG